ncbi:hypothetical protein ACWEPD_18915 [Streptomyces pseudogriseolus]|uniref:hypothetical protein n=1 Tax=Streptomyces pseudogriseolus TaxID=36817 RepID=UPI00347E7BA5|nr:hypothetical protein [Streptomyces pseudogriseolus]
MPRSRSRRSLAHDASAVLAEAEGIVLARSHLAEARREAEALCADLPWLTSGQAEDLTRRYVDRRIDLTRQMLRTTVRRADELRREYETRYTDLRGALLRRHVAWASVLLACATGTNATLWLLTR